MRLAILVTVFAAMGAHPVLAQNDEVMRGPEPAWVSQSELAPLPEDVEGAIFVRRQDVLVHLDDKGQQQYLGYRIRVLHPSALQLGNLSLAWNPQAGSPTVHVIKVHRDGQVIDLLKTAQFEILRREDQLEAASLDGILTAILRISDLRVGDELEYGMTTRTDDPTLGNLSAGLLTLAPSLPSGRFRLGLSWTKNQKPNIKLTDDLKSIAQISDQALELTFDDPPLLNEIKDAPLRFQWQRVAQFSDYPDWAEISRHFAPLYASATKISDRSPIKQEASRIASAHEGMLDRAQAALQMVQRDVRYIYVGFDGGNLKPASAEETWKRRYGDCKGKTALLLALLAELGIEAEPVLANNSGIDDGFDQRLPNPGLFDHVLVRAKIDGAIYYLDGTLPDVVGPDVKPFMPYRWILPLTLTGSDIEQMAWTPPSQPEEMNLFEIDAKAGFDQPARITHTIITRGLDGLREHVQFSALTQQQLQTGLSQQLIGDVWQSVDKVSWRYDKKTQASVMTISGTGRVDWEKDGGDARSLALPGGGFSPPARRIRPLEQDQDLPYVNQPGFSCYVTTLRLPASSQENHWSFKSGFDTRIFGRNYYRVFGISDGAIRMIRASRVEKREIDAKSAIADNALIDAFDNSRGYVFYNPGESEMPAFKGLHVPATDEVDWIADNSACLAPDTLPRPGHSALSMPN